MPTANNSNILATLSVMMESDGLEKTILQITLAEKRSRGKSQQRLQMDITSIFTTVTGSERTARERHWFCRKICAAISWTGYANERRMTNANVGNFQFLPFNQYLANKNNLALGCPCLHTIHIYLGRPIIRILIRQNVVSMRFPKHPHPCFTRSFDLFDYQRKIIIIHLKILIRPSAWICFITDSCNNLWRQINKF